MDEDAPPDRRFSRARVRAASPPPCARSSSRPAFWPPSLRRRSARRPYPPSWPQPSSPSSLWPSLSRSCEPVPSSPPPSSQAPSWQPSCWSPSSRLAVLPARLPPPPSCLFTVAQAMRSAVPSLAPRSRSLSSMCSAWRFCFSVYADLSPRGMTILLSLWSGQQAQGSRAHWRWRPPPGMPWRLLLRRCRGRCRPSPPSAAPGRPRRWRWPSGVPTPG